MEQFMLIFHLGADGHTYQNSPEAIQANLGRWMTWIEKLRKENRYVGGDPLLPGGKTVSGNSGKSITDGPFTEGKEVVGGYFIVNAKDMDEAAALCSGYPDFEYGGTVEVRQIMKVNKK